MYYTKISSYLNRVTTRDAIRLTVDLAITPIQPHELTDVSELPAEWAAASIQSVTATVTCDSTFCSAYSPILIKINAIPSKATYGAADPLCFRSITGAAQRYSS